MNFQGVVLNVADLDRSIAFYGEVLDFTLLSQREELAAVRASGTDRHQVIVLRALGRGLVGGAGRLGLQAFVVEVESDDQLERIASELETRKALVSRHEHPDWVAVVGRDPDRVAVVVVWHPGGGRMTEDGSRTLDDFLYGIGE